MLYHPAFEPGDDRLTFTNSKASWIHWCKSFINSWYIHQKSEETSSPSQFVINQSADKMNGFVNNFGMMENRKKELSSEKSVFLELIWSKSKPLILTKYTESYDGRLLDKTINGDPSNENSENKACQKKIGFMDLWTEQLVDNRSVTMSLFVRTTSSITWMTILAVTQIYWAIGNNALCKKCSRQTESKGAVENKDENNQW